MIFILIGVFVLLFISVALLPIGKAQTRARRHLPPPDKRA